MNQPDPPPKDNGAFARFKQLTAKVVAVPKPEIDKREAEYKASKKAKPKFKRSG